MRSIGSILAIATIAGALAGCADPDYPRYSQGYAYPGSSPARYGYGASPPGDGYSATAWDYYNYLGI